MKYLKIKLFFLINAFAFSCTMTDEKVSTLVYMKSYYSKEDLQLKNKQVYILTALEGCGACVDYTIKFIEQNLDNNQMIFIVSGRSKKELYMKLNSRIIDSKNFIFDNKLIALKEKLIDSVHPKVFLIEKGQLTNSFEVNYVSADSLFKVTKNFLK